MPQNNAFYRLTEAREMRGLTVAELAERINVTRQVVYRYENGTQVPSDDVAQRIQHALDMPSSFFAAPRSGIDISDRTIFFRDMKTNQEKNRKMARRWLQILHDHILRMEEYLDFPTVNLPDLDLPDYSTLTNEDIELAAEKLRRSWGLGDGPISNVTQLLENNGFIILRKHMPAEKMDACSMLVQGRPCVLINTYKQTCSRDIMNLAHELGHLILHQEVSVEDLESNAAFNTIEDQAWRFAKAFLMPPVVFSAEVGYPTLQRFISLKRRWRVSIAAMILYCCDLYIINDARKQYFFREMTRLKMRKEEPLDNDLPVEHSSLLLDAEKLIVDNNILTREKLFELSNLNLSDYCELLNVPTSYFKPISIKPRLRLI